MGKWTGKRSGPGCRGGLSSQVTSFVLSGFSAGLGLAALIITY